MPVGLLDSRYLGREWATITIQTMGRIRDSAPQAGLAMGFIFVVVGLVTGIYGIVGLGVVVGLAGFFNR